MREEDLLRKLKSRLPPERYRHSLSVARWAAALARRHGAAAGRARLAGQLHDCARGRGKKNALSHARLSAGQARRHYGVRDRAVLEAIARHTLGVPRMTRLDKILFVADYSSADRTHGSAAVVRRLARRDLQKAFLETVRWKRHYVLLGGGTLHPLSVALWKKINAKTK